MTEHVVNLYMHEIAMHVDHNVDELAPPFTGKSFSSIAPPREQKVTDTQPVYFIPYPPLSACILFTSMSLFTSIVYFNSNTLSTSITNSWQLWIENGTTDLCLSFSYLQRLVLRVSLYNKRGRLLILSQKPRCEEEERFRKMLL